MDIFDLEQQEIEVLYLRKQDLTPTQIQVKLNISSTEYFERQKSALTKLEIPGESKEKWTNFERSIHAGTLSKLTEEDIKNWSQRREDLRKRFSPGTPARFPAPFLYGLAVLAILAVGILLGRALFATPPNTSATSSPDSAASSVSPETSPNSTPVNATQIPETSAVVPTETLAPTMTSTLTPAPTETISPIGLVEGQELSDGRVTLKLNDVRYNQLYDPVSQPYAPISYYFDFTNHSGDVLLLQADGDNFVMTDDTNAQVNCWFVVVIMADPAINIQVNNGETREIIARCGRGMLNENVSTVTLSITDFSSLPDSTWVHEVQR